MIVDEFDKIVEEMASCLDDTCKEEYWGTPQDIFRSLASEVRRTMFEEVLEVQQEKELLRGLMAKYPDVVRDAK